MFCENITTGPDYSGAWPQVIQSTPYMQGKRILGLTYSIDISPGKYPVMLWQYNGIHAGSNNQNLEVYLISNPFSIKERFFYVGITNWGINYKDFGVRKLNLYTDPVYRSLCYNDNVFGLTKILRYSTYGKIVIRLHELEKYADDLYRGQVTVHFRNNNNEEYPITDINNPSYIYIMYDPSYPNEFDNNFAFYRYDGSNFDLYFEIWHTQTVVNREFGRINIGDGSRFKTTNKQGLEIEAISYNSSTDTAMLKLYWDGYNVLSTSRRNEYKIITIYGKDYYYRWTGVNLQNNSIYLETRDVTPQLWGNVTSSNPQRITLEEIKYYDKNTDNIYTTNPLDYGLVFNYPSMTRVHSDNHLHTETCITYTNYLGHMIAELTLSGGEYNTSCCIDNCDLLLRNFYLEKQQNFSNPTRFICEIENTGSMFKTFTLKIYVDGALFETITDTINGNTIYNKIIELKNLNPGLRKICPEITW